MYNIINRFFCDNLKNSCGIFLRSFYDLTNNSFFNFIRYINRYYITYGGSQMKSDDRFIAIYSRKSKFTGKGESIENQVEMCKRKLSYLFPDLDESKIIIYEDEGYSGSNTNRPQFQQMIKAVKNNKIKAVCCYKLDRISRSVGDFNETYNILQNWNTKFISVTEDFNTNTPMGSAMLRISSIFAELERETIAERIRDNMCSLAKTGCWLGGTTPTGYKSTEIIERIEVNGKKRKAYKLTVINNEAEIVKIIFSKFAEFNSLTKTETYLINHNIRTKNNKYFTRFSIKAILQNPVYMTADNFAYDYFYNISVPIYSNKEEFSGEYGVMIYNKTVQGTNKRKRIREFESWIAAVGRHKSIISSDDWIKVQKLLKQNTSKSYHKPKSNVALLSGLLYCQNCGSFMRPKLSQRINKNDEQIYSYLCELKEKSKCCKCNIKNPNGNLLDKSICNEIKKFASDKSEFFKALEKAKIEFSKADIETNKQINSLEKSFKNNQTKISNLVSLLADSNIGFAGQRIMEEINTLGKENENIQVRISELERKTNFNELSDTTFKLLNELLCSFSYCFDKMSVEQKRNALRIFIKRIEWDGENINIYLIDSTEKQ